MTRHTPGCPAGHRPTPGRTTTAHAHPGTHADQDRERPFTHTESAVRHRRVVRNWLAQPTALFGGVYGLLVASSAVAALTRFGETTRAARMDDALWVLFTALASALAHGYAHQIAHRDAQSRPGIWGVVRAAPGLGSACLPGSRPRVGASRRNRLRRRAPGGGRGLGQHPAEVTRRPDTPESVVPARASRRSGLHRARSGRGAGRAGKHGPGCRRTLPAAGPVSREPTDQYVSPC